MAWLTNWNYRKAITISNSGSLLTNYQIQITIDTASLIIATKLRSDCGDIRFTDTDGSTLINYWIESGCNTSTTSIWIKVPSIPNGTKIIYLYYGNPLEISLSNGTNTFLVFDDFESGDKTWTNPTLNPISTTRSYSGTKSRFITSGTPSILSFSNFTDNISIEYMFNQNVAGSQGSDGQYAKPTTNAQYYGTYYNAYYAASYHTLGNLISLNTWYKVRWIYSASTGGSSTPTKQIFNGYETPWGNTGNLSIPTDFRIWAGVGSAYIDNLFIRNYTSLEPTPSLGIEEVQTCGTPSANLIVLEILSNQLSRTYPNYIDIDAISNIIDSYSNNSDNI